jgi:mono/diheme cytochrome c family protein
MRAAVAVLAVALVALAVWLLWPQARSSRGDDPARIALGKTVYGQYCASCHGANLEGQPNWMSRKPDGRLPAPPHDETGHTWHHPTEQLFQMTKHGMKPPLAPQGYESDMPAFADLLSDAQIEAVLAYIKSRWPDEIRERQRRNDEAYRQSRSAIPGNEGGFR